MSGEPNSRIKLQSLFFTLVMVSSMMVGTIALAGTAAANAPDNGSFAAGNAPADNTADDDTTTNGIVTVTDLQFESNGNIANVTVDPSGGNDATGITTSDIASLEINAGLDNGTVITRSVDGVSSLPREVDFSNSATASGEIVQDLTVVIETTDTVDGGDAFDNTINITAPDGTDFDGASSPYDTAGIQTVSDDNGFIAGDATEEGSGDSLPGVEIEIFEDDGNTADEIDSGDSLVATTETNSNGRYTATVVASSTSGNDYLVRADRSGFETAASQGAVEVGSGTTTTVDLVLSPEQIVENVDVTAEPADATVSADGTTEINYTVEVTGQSGTDTGVGIGGRTVELSPTTTVEGDITVTDSDGDTSTLSGTSDTVSATTNSDGFASFNLSSSTVQTVDLEFTESTSGESDTATATFEEIINDGPGSIRGDIGNEVTGESIEGASVYAIQAPRFERNAQSVSEDFSTFGISDNAASFRLINDDTGQIVDADQYRVAPTFADVVSKAFPLNESDSAAGNGFVYDDDGSGSIEFIITPLQSANYTLQIAPGSSPSNVEFEDTDNVTSFADTDVPLDLTQTAIENRFNETDAVVSDETDERGEYTLTQLFIPGPTGGESQTNIKDGNYVVTATATNFTRDFAVEQVSDNDPAQSFIDIEPREPQPADTVDITNLATIPSGELDGQQDAFENTSDEFRQRVPRDGRTLDVVQVETSNADGPANGSVTLNVSASGEASAFDSEEGGFLNEAGENVGQQTTVTTGTDGTATVLLRADDSSSDTNGSISASLAGASGSTATDTTNKSFVGVTDFETGSISGLVTNSSDVALPDSLVFVSQFDFGAELSTGDEEFRFTLEPVQEPEQVDQQDLTFDITFQQYNTTSGQYETVGTDTDVAFTTLTNGEYQFGAFANVSAAPGVSGFELATNTDGDASYTLEPVPATGSVDYTVTGVKLSDPDAGTTGAALTEVLANVTGTANIVIPGAEPTQPAQFTVSNLSPTDVTVEQGDEITVTADIQNTGTATATQTVEFRVGGNAVASRNVTLDGGNSTTVTFENVSTAALDAGSFTHGVFTEGGSQTATLTVTTGDTNSDVPSDLQRFTGDDGELDGFDLVEAVNAANQNEEIGGEPVDGFDIVQLVNFLNQ